MGMGGGWENGDGGRRGKLYWGGGEMGIGEEGEMGMGEEGEMGMWGGGGNRGGEEGELVTSGRR